MFTIYYFPTCLQLTYAQLQQICTQLLFPSTFIISIHILPPKTVWEHLVFSDPLLIFPYFQTPTLSSALQLNLTQLSTPTHTATSWNRSQYCTKISNNKPHFHIKTSKYTQQCLHNTHREKLNSILQRVMNFTNHCICAHCTIFTLIIHRNKHNFDSKTILSFFIGMSTIYVSLQITN
jgi:hypothetical protein